MDKHKQRFRRASRARAKIKRLGATRLTVHRSLNHIYAQVISPCGSKVIAAASTVEKDLSENLKHAGNVDAAALIGKTVAERALKAGVKAIAFDRAGYKFHGRVKALANAAREAGLKF
jgi:large subunit ribosomal protein L18